MGGGDGGYKSKSSLSKQQEPVAQAMFEIFKSGLAKGLPSYPGSGATTAFNPQAVRQNFQQNVGQPMQNLWQDRFAPLIGRDAQGYAQGRQAETMAALGSTAVRTGEDQAYKEWLRVQPTGQAMNLGQAMIGQSYTGTYMPENRSTSAAYGILSGLNAASQMAILGSMGGGQGTAGQASPWGYGITSPYVSDRYMMGQDPNMLWR